MIILDSYNIQGDFWKLNPQLTVAKEFQDLKNGLIELEDEIMSSMVMWAIALVHDYYSKYFNLPIKEREKLIEEDYLDIPGFFVRNRKPLKKVIDRYQYFQKDSEVRFLDVWNKKVDEITQIIRKKKVTEKNMSEITSLLLNQEKLMEQKDNIMERLEKSNVNLGIRGGGELSLLEGGRLK